MSGRILRQFLREWAALLAVFAMVLAPLGTAVARGLTASDHVAVAAGLSPPPLCLPAEKAGARTEIPAHGCDHCLPVLTSATHCPSLTATAFRFSERLQPADTGPSALLEQLRLPPGTGPPAA